VTDVSHTPIFLSLSLSLFSQSSRIIWHSRFLYTAPYSLHPSPVDPHHWNHSHLNSELPRFAPFIPCHPLIIFPLHHFSRHLDSVPIHFHSPWFLSFSFGIPHQLYILRTCVSLFHQFTAACAPFRRTMPRLILGNHLFTPGCIPREFWTDTKVTTQKLSLKANRASPSVADASSRVSTTT